MAPVMSTGDMPPISAQICFQLQPFSRLMADSFSVGSARVIADYMTISLLAAACCLGVIFFENRCPPSDQVLGHAFRDHAPCASEARAMPKRCNFAPETAALCVTAVKRRPGRH